MRAYNLHSEDLLFALALRFENLAHISQVKMLRKSLTLNIARARVKTLNQIPHMQQIDMGGLISLATNSKSVQENDTDQPEKPYM